MESEENLIGSPTNETGLKKTAKLAEKEKTVVDEHDAETDSEAGETPSEWNFTVIPEK